MNIAFYIDEMNFRGIANSTYQYALNNQKILKNKSIIFYNKKNLDNKKEVIIRFKKKFKIFGINSFNEIELSKNRLKIDYIYTQKGGEKDKWISKKIETLIHSVYPQSLNQVHGHRYASISEWLSKKFYNNKISPLPYIVEIDKSKINLKKKLKIKKNQIIFGCHGGVSSFDLKFVKDTLKKIVNKRKDIVVLFLNIKKFINHPRIIFLKGSSDNTYKKRFLNTCDAMIYGRSLGESFGLACGEFAVQGKKLILYNFNRHRSHMYNLDNNCYEEYSSCKTLYKILNNFKKRKINKIYQKNNKYLKYNSKIIMRKFDQIFLKNNVIKKLNLYDYLINYFGFVEMNFYYLRHKIYTNYYRLIESKLNL